MEEIPIGKNFWFIDNLHSLTLVPCILYIDNLLFSVTCGIETVSLSFAGLG